MNKLIAVYLVLECGLNMTMKNAIVINVYNIPHAAGKYAGGGVSGGFESDEYQEFITEFFNYLFLITLASLLIN